MTFQAYAEEWRRAQVHRASTAKACESYLRVHVYPTLGARPIGAIRRSEIQGWVKGRSEVLAPGSVELAYRWVATIFKSAVSDRIISASPCLRIALPKASKGEVQPLAPEAVHALAAASASASPSTGSTSSGVRFASTASSWTFERAHQSSALPRARRRIGPFPSPRLSLTAGRSPGGVPDPGALTDLHELLRPPPQAEHGSTRPGTGLRSRLASLRAPCSTIFATSTPQP